MGKEINIFLILLLSFLIIAFFIDIVLALVILGFFIVFIYRKALGYLILIPLLLSSTIVGWLVQESFYNDLFYGVSAGAAVSVIVLYFEKRK